MSAEGNFNIAVGNWGKTTKAAAGEMKRKASWLGWDGNGGSSQAGLGLDLIRFRKKKRFSFFVLIRIRV